VQWHQDTNRALRLNKRNVMYHRREFRVYISILHTVSEELLLECMFSFHMDDVISRLVH